jgi:mono/diheme cytochrome c family protein
VRSRRRGWRAPSPGSRSSPRRAAAKAAGDREPGTSAEDYVRESLLDPGKVVVEGFGNVMPSFDGKLDDAQLKALVDYLLQQGGG